MTRAKAEGEGAAPSPARVPASRRAGLDALLAEIERADRVALTTHVNADGDGAGSEAALAAWLAQRGIPVAIVNPTPFPDDFAFLLEDPAVVADAGSAAGDGALREADLVVILDTGEPDRIGRVAKAIVGKKLGILDHHPAGARTLDATGVVDPEAAATGELVFDLLAHAAGAGRDVSWSRGVLEGIYAALLTDTGSFRFSNTSPRTHEIAAYLLARGVDPERLYREIYATASVARMRLLQEALSRLETDPELPLTWISIPHEVVRDLGVTASDFETVTEHARMVKGTEIAVLLRGVADGSTKVSLRSNGRADVNRIARELGGGGHTKAAGAVIGAPLAEARERVLDAARQALRELSAG
jgi:phosphoesterase RecJ-like protein